MKEPFLFNYNNIFTANVSNNDYTEFNGTSGNSTDNDISFINFSGTYPNLSMNTDLSNNTGQIIFTVINSAPTIDKSFNVIINIDISDTIYPKIEFENTETIDYTIDISNFRGSPTQSIFNTTISLNQSYIFDNPGNNLLPSAYSYDQFSTTDRIDCSHIDLSSIIYDQITDTSINISYTPGEWKPGIYNIQYFTKDSFNHETIVNVSFEIVDNIFPTITIIKDQNSDVSGYINHASNTNYTVFTYDDSADVASGRGFDLSDIFARLSNGSTNSVPTTSQESTIIYIILMLVIAHHGIIL